MTELVKGSTDLSNDAAADYAADLLRHYSFDLGEYTVEQLLSYWLGQYDSNWIRLAVIEALYQGRYKAISVEQILALWQRRGQPSYHFNHEFERLVCDRLPRNLSPRPVAPQANGSKRSARLELPPAPISNQLYYLKNQITELSEPGTEPSTNTQSPLSSSADGDADASAPQETDTPVGPEQPQSPAERLANSPLGRALLSLPDAPPPIDHQPAVTATKAATTTSLSDEANVVGLSNLLTLGSLAQPLKPKLQLHLTTLYQPSWLVPLDNQQPIHQFTPVPDASEFHTKLKAVAQPDSCGSLTASDKIPETTAPSCLQSDAEVAP